MTRFDTGLPHLGNTYKLILCENGSTDDTLALAILYRDMPLTLHSKPAELSPELDKV